MGVGTDLRRSVDLCWEELCSVIGSSGFEHAEDRVEEFSCDCHEGLELGLVTRLKLVIEVSEVRVEASSAESRHVEGVSEMAVAVAAGRRGLGDGSSGGGRGRSGPAPGKPLAH